MVILSACIFLIINSYFIEIKNIEIPIMHIASNLGLICKYIYGLSILIAIFTTAISSGYGFLNSITNSKKAYFIFCLISILFRTIKIF